MKFLLISFNESGGTSFKKYGMVVCHRRQILLHKTALEIILNCDKLTKYYGVIGQNVSEFRSNERAFVESGRSRQLKMKVDFRTCQNDWNQRITEK